jgi:hypothetical protein
MAVERFRRFLPLAITISLGIVVFAALALVAWRDWNHDAWANVPLWALLLFVAYGIVAPRSGVAVGLIVGVVTIGPLVGALQGNGGCEGRSSCDEIPLAAQLLFSVPFAFATTVTGVFVRKWWLSMRGRGGRTQGSGPRDVVLGPGDPPHSQ